MPAALNAPSDPTAPVAWSQRLKWGVYALLFLDFLLYFVQDAQSAKYTLSAEPTFLEWARAYVTSIDLAAWFLLILFFEIETGPLRDRTRSLTWRSLTQGLRVVCYVAILHTSFADVGILLDFRFAQALPASADLCAYADGGWSFLENRGYTTIDARNCAALGAGPGWFVVGSGTVIVDPARLHEGLILAWTDVAESLAWLLIIAINEVIVRRQARGAASGALLTVGNRFKGALYTLIVCIALYWGSKGQILYLWDELLWVGGFALIEKNIFEWRARLRRNFSARVEREVTIAAASKQEGADT